MRFLVFLVLILGTYTLGLNKAYGEEPPAPKRISYNPHSPSSSGSGPVYEWNGLFEGEWPDDSTIIIIPLRSAAMTTQLDSAEINEMLEGYISYTNNTITHQFFEDMGIIKLCVIDEYGFIHVGKYVDTSIFTSDLIDISILPERRFSIYCVLPNGQKLYYNFTIEE